MTDPEVYVEPPPSSSDAYVEPGAASIHAGVEPAPPQSMMRCGRNQTEEFKAKERQRKRTARAKAGNKAEERIRRQTDEYKAREKNRQQSDDYKAKEKMRRRTHEHKAKEKMRRRPDQRREYFAMRWIKDEKTWRNQCSQLAFWKQVLTQWYSDVEEQLEIYRAEVFFSDNPDLELVIDDARKRVLEEGVKINAQPYAPRFASDGAISIVQHGVVHRLPQVMRRPRGSQTLSGSLEEHELALSLRCAVSCKSRCLWEEDKDVLLWAKKKFGYRCPMQASGTFGVPRLAVQIKPFLCNNRCPQKCCTQLCPWYSSDSGNFADPSIADMCLQDPPLPGCRLYTGIGDPVSDSPPVRVKVFVLCCEHFKSKSVRLGASRVGFLDRIDRSSGFQSYPRQFDSSDYEQVFPDVIVPSGVDTAWTKQERDAWLAQPSLHKWTWRRLSLDLFPKGAFTAKEYIGRRLQALLMSRRMHRHVVSNVVEGPTSTTCTFCKYVSGKSDVPPEDIAIRAAEAFATFQAALECTTAILGPWDVLTIGDNWKHICATLTMSLAQALPGISACEQEQRSFVNMTAALKMVVGTLRFLEEELATRVDVALARKKQRDSDDKERRTFVVQSLSELNILSLLLQYSEPGCIFAAEADDGGSLSSFEDVDMQALGCKCSVPWHDRDFWERRAFSQYKLPTPTSLWQSKTLKLSSGVCATIWQKRGDGVRHDPVNLFTLGTIPQRQQAMHGHELSNSCHMRALFHTCWTKWRLELEQRLAESDNATGSELDVDTGEEEEKAIEKEPEEQANRSKEVRGILNDKPYWLSHWDIDSINSQALPALEADGCDVRSLPSYVSKHLKQESIAESFSSETEEQDVTLEEPSCEEEEHDQNNEDQDNNVDSLWDTEFNGQNADEPPNIGSVWMEILWSSVSSTESFVRCWAPHDFSGREEIAWRNATYNATTSPKSPHCFAGV